MARQLKDGTLCMACLSAASWCDDCNLSHVTAERDALRAEVAALKAGLVEFREWWDAVYPRDVITGASDSGASPVLALRAVLDRLLPAEQVTTGKDGG